MNMSRYRCNGLGRVSVCSMVASFSRCAHVAMSQHRLIEATLQIGIRTNYSHFIEDTSSHFLTLKHLHYYPWLSDWYKSVTPIPLNSYYYSYQLLKMSTPRMLTTVINDNNVALGSRSQTVWERDQ